jgi:hypothetical protein
MDLQSIQRELMAGSRIGPVACHESVYRASPGASQSTLKKMKHSAAKCLWEMEHPRPSSEAQELGTAIHAALLEPDVFNDEYVVKPKFDRRTKVGKEGSELWEAANAGKRGIDQADMDTVNRVAARVYDNDFYGRFFKSGQKEVSFWSRDPDIGALKRCRLDNYIAESNIIVDLKTTDCAAPDVFKKDIWKYLYHVQAAYYTDLVKEVTGRDCAFFIVAVEKTMDCDVSVHLIGQEAIANGRHMYKTWLEKYHQAVCLQRWDGYAQDIHTYSLPAWATEVVHDF